MKKTKPKGIIAYAIVGSFESWFLTADKQYMIYYDKKSAKQHNKGMDEDIVEVIITKKK